jgi:hypothetical protein
MIPSRLIVIHGVGDAPPGAGLAEVSQGLLAGGAVTERADLLIEGVTFPRARVERHEVAEVVEVNWSDVERPDRTMIGLLDYWARIVVALLKVGTASTSPESATSKRGAPLFAWLYRVAFEALLVYSIYPAMVTMFWMAVQPGRTAVVTAVGGLGTAIIAGLTFYLSRFAPAFRIGWFWALAVVIATLALMTGHLSPNAVVCLAAFAYAGAQMITSTLLFAALLQVLFDGSTSKDCRVARMGILYFPFFILSAVGALIWAVSLALVNWLPDTKAGAQTWQGTFSASLSSVGYDLALIEFTFALMVSLLAIGALAIVAIYVKRSRDTTKHAGAFARDSARNLIAAGALTFALLTIVYVIAGATKTRFATSELVWVVYTISSLRIVPYIPLMVGPLSLVAGIVVDILFYIVPDERMSTAPTLHRRLQTIIDYMRSTGNAPIVVAAHSQGTIIAIDVLGRESSIQSSSLAPMYLVTAGSPIASLYKRFLNSTPENRSPRGLDGHSVFVPPREWVNFCREGDYIGGRQDRNGVVEESLGLGGHTLYWGESKLWRATVLSSG